MWDIVIWSEGGAIDFIPSSWKHEERDDLYKYPFGLSDTKIRQIIYESKDLNEKYRWCAATIKRKGISSLQKAKKLCEQGQYTTHLETSDEEIHQTEKRISKPTRRYVPSDGSSDSENEETVLQWKKKAHHIENSHRDDEIQTSATLNEHHSLPTLSRVSKKGDKKTGSEETAFQTKRRDEREEPRAAATLTKHFRLPASSTVSRFNLGYDLFFVNFDITCEILLDGTETDCTNQVRGTISNVSTVTLTPDNFSNAKIIFELKEINNRLNKIENLLLTTKTSVSDITCSEFIDTLPAKTEEELKELDGFINTNKDKFHELVNMLYLLGGTDAHKSVFLIMNKLFAKTLAPLYSGQGKKKKKAFAELKCLYNAVFVAVRKRHSSETDENIKKYVGLFLATAKARMGSTPNGSNEPV